jgi:hypothetical protein
MLVVVGIDASKGDQEGLMQQTCGSSLGKRQMYYYLDFIPRRHMTDDIRAEVINSTGETSFPATPLEGGALSPEARAGMPIRFVILSGSDSNQIAPAGTSFFTVTNEVKKAIEGLDPAFEFYPMDLEDRVHKKTIKNALWLLYSPYRRQVINLEATGPALRVEQSPPKMINGKLFEYPKFYRVSSISELVMDAKAVAGCHLFKGSARSLSSSWFCSEEFKRAVEPFRRTFDFIEIPAR